MRFGKTCSETFQGESTHPRLSSQHLESAQKYAIPCSHFLFMLSACWMYYRSHSTCSKGALCRLQHLTMGGGPISEHQLFQPGVSLGNLQEWVLQDASLVSLGSLHLSGV